MQHHHESESSAVAARSATLHCLTGCAIGEVLGLAIGAALLLSTAATIGLAIVLAFFFGYLLTVVALRRQGTTLLAALGIALASDTLSIGVMEFVDNVVLLMIPGAMEAGPGTALFWASLAVALFAAFWAAFPLNWWLLKRGRGHSLNQHDRIATRK